MKRIIILELDGSIPSKKNSKQIFRNTRTGRPFITSSKDHKKWHETAMYQMNLQKVNIKDVDFPIQKCEYIETTIFYGDKIGRDNTNVVESIHDLLVDSGIIIDDNWKVTGKTCQHPVFREKQPGATIIIKTDNAKEIKLSEGRGASNSRGEIRNKSGNVSGYSRRSKPTTQAITGSGN